MSIDREQERETLYDALRIIEVTLRRRGIWGIQDALDTAQEALVVARLGERLEVLDWRAIRSGDLTVTEAYERIKKC